jgi:hypothetical protein
LLLYLGLWREEESAMLKSGRGKLTRQAKLGFMFAGLMFLPSAVAAQTMSWFYDGYAASITLTQFDPTTGGSSTKLINCNDGSDERL